MCGKEMATILELSILVLFGNGTPDPAPCIAIAIGLVCRRVALSMMAGGGGDLQMIIKIQFPFK